MALEPQPNDVRDGQIDPPVYPDPNPEAHIPTAPTLEERVSKLEAEMVRIQGDALSVETVPIGRMAPDDLMDFLHHIHPTELAEWIERRRVEKEPAPARYDPATGRRVDPVTGQPIPEPDLRQRGMETDPLWNPSPARTVF